MTPHGTNRRITDLHDRGKESLLGVEYVGAGQRGVSSEYEPLSE
jgi:hypothetical protein